ncbi:penicillin acylase family protein [Massilia sp. B-10]|nr:penicillin acylase family protein [Massilia sp. B-10]
MISQRKRLVVTDLQTLAFANRIHAAELVLPEFLPLCQGSPDQQIRSACNALANWDRKVNLDSRGAVLFREFWNLAADIPGKWQIPLDVNDPVNTPRSLAPSAGPAMLAALKAAAGQLAALNIPFDATGRLPGRHAQWGAGAGTRRHRRHRWLVQLDPHGHRTDRERLPQHCVGHELCADRHLRCG